MHYKLLSPGAQERSHLVKMRYAWIAMPFGLSITKLRVQREGVSEVGCNRFGVFADSPGFFRFAVLRAMAPTLVKVRYDWMATPLGLSMTKLKGVARMCDRSWMQSFLAFLQFS